MRERPFPSGLEFLDDGRSRKRVVLAVLALCYLGIWAGFWSRHHLWAAALGLLVTVIALSIYRFVPSFLVRLDATRRDCLVEWRAGPLAKRRVFSFDEVVGIERSDSTPPDRVGGQTTNARSRLEFVLRDGTRMPWIDYHSSARNEQETQRRQALGLIRGDVAADGAGG